ncbi:MAG: biotin/lipoyl-binding protein, partial [Nitrospinota bacterium]|nr:biotin/lipoyl-binding protein [Nitrospinota bacterium]
MRRLVTMVVVLIALGGGAYAAYINFQDDGGATRFRYIKVDRGSLASVVSPSGTLNAINTIQVGSQISGQILQLYADYNSRVQKDQVIAQISPEVFEAKVDKARADLSASHATVRMHQAQIERAGADRDNAMADLADAKAQRAKSQVDMLDASRTFKRKKELYRQGLIPRSEIDSAQAAYDSAVAQADSFVARERAKSSGLLSSRAQLKVNKAQLQDAAARVKQSEASLRQADEDLKRTIIRSPVEGVVVSRNVDVGQTVAASLQAPTLFTIAEDLKRM